jgi:hypothetical protein
MIHKHAHLHRVSDQASERVKGNKSSEREGEEEEGKKYCPPQAPSGQAGNEPGKVAPDTERIGQLGSIEGDVELQSPIQIFDTPCPETSD